MRGGLGEEGAWSPAQMAEWFTGPGEGVLEGVLDEGEKGSGPSEGEVKEGRGGGRSWELLGCCSWASLGERFTPSDLL